VPVSPDSRFAGLPVLDVAAPDGGRRHVVALRLKRPPAGPATARHRLLEGEGIDLIAQRAYGAEDLWWRVLDGNDLVHPFDLRPGQVLALPAPGPASRTTRARSF
jgi:hypothetical protein